MVLGFMLTLTGASIIFRNSIEKFLINTANKNCLPDMTQDLDKVDFKSGNKRVLIVIMGLGVFVTYHLSVPVLSVLWP